MQAPQTILVPVTGAQSSLDAVATACAIAKPRRAEVLVLHVIEVLRSLPMNTPLEEEARRGDQILRRAEEVAARADYHVTGELVQAREACQAIVEEARDRAVDAVVLGIRARQGVGEFRLGRTAEYVMKHAPCQVWLVREAAKEPAPTAGARR